MKTINEAIGERLAHIKNIKKMDGERAAEIVYKKHPKLRKIDGDLLEVRTQLMLCAIEHDKAPVPALEKRESDLLKEREEYLKENKLPEDPSSVNVHCDKCEDTGFVTTKDGRKAVCASCMKDVLENVFAESGMKDFVTYDIKSFDINYYKDDGVRAREFKGLRKLMEGKSEKSLMLLTGGVQTGKTYLAIVSCKYAIITGLSAQYLKADRLFDLSYDDLDVLKAYDFIVIDDYAAEVTNNNKIANVLHTLLEARLASGRATVIVSSSPLEVLVADSDERIAGKLRTAGTL